MRAEPPQQHHTRLWIGDLRLFAEYGLRSGLAVQAMLPVRTIRTRTSYTDLAGNPITLDYADIHHRNQTLVGAGDVQLALHAAARWGPILIGGRGGLSVPLGTVHDNPYRLGDMGLPHEHIQFGTGTFDPILGGDATHVAGRWATSLFGQAQLPFYRGRHGFQAGARFLGGLSGALRWGGGAGSLRLGAVAVHENAERWDGLVPVEDGNQGRTDLFVGPGVTVPLGGDWSASFDLRVRAYGHAVNAQLDLPVILELAIGRLLHLEPGRHVEPEAPGGDVSDAVSAGEAAVLAPVPGKWTVFDFWATWCEACRTLDADLRRLAAEDGGVAIRRVNIVDMDSPIARAELPGVDTLPHVRLLAPDGHRVWEASGVPAVLMGEIRARVSAPPSPR